VESDLEKAAKIVADYGSFSFKGGNIREEIAVAVARGIALGRREGIAVTADAISLALSQLRAAQGQTNA
jgi:hypothetical protein